MPTKSRHQLPIFTAYNVVQLAESLDYSERYMVDLKEGTKPVRRRFKIYASKMLGRSVEELFGPQDADDA